MAASDNIPVPVSSDAIRQKFDQRTATILNSLLDNQSIVFAGPNAYALGSPVFSGNVTIEGNLTVEGTSDLQGATTVGGPFTAEQAARFENQVTVEGPLYVEAGADLTAPVTIKDNQNGSPSLTVENKNAGKNAYAGVLLLSGGPSASALVGVASSTSTSFPPSSFFVAAVDFYTTANFTVGSPSIISGNGSGLTNLPAASITGTLPVANGGTGATALTGYVKGNGTSAFTAAAAIPTSDLSGTISLTSQVTGILPTANGGTGIAFFTAAGPTAARTYTFPDSNQTVACLAVGNTFTAAQAVAVTSGSALSSLSVRNSSSGASARQALSVFNNNGSTAYTNGVSLFINSSGNSGSPGGVSAAGVWQFENAPLVFGSNNALRLTMQAAGESLWAKQEYFGTATLTDAANIAWNLTDAQVAKVTLGGNRTLDNPTNMKDGGVYILRVIQDGTGTRTLAYGTAYKWPGGVAPVVTATAGAVSILYFVSDGTNMYGRFDLAFA